MQVFFKYILIFKNQSNINIDALKIFYRLTLSFRLNSSSEKPSIELNVMEIAMYILIVFCYSQVFLGSKISYFQEKQ